MRRDLDELSERGRRQAQEELIIPAGEFVALFTAALLTLGLLAGPVTLASTAKTALIASATTLSDSFAQMAMHMDARASDQSAVSQTLSGQTRRQLAEVQRLNERRAGSRLSWRPSSRNHRRANRAL